MADKNLRINLVLSVLPAPLSPLKDNMQKFVLLIKQKTKPPSLASISPIRPQNNFSFEFYFNYFFIQQVLISCPFYTHQCIHVNPNLPVHPTTTTPFRFPPLVSIRLFSASVSLFLPCKPVHLCHFSRFHMYALIYTICFSLSDVLHSVQLLNSGKELKVLSYREESLLLPAAWRPCCQRLPQPKQKVPPSRGSGNKRDSAFRSS